MLGPQEPADVSHLPGVPLFPLPNVVLFPRAVLPLHIFEERYKEMTADALRGRRLIAMSLLRPGWERDYYSKPAIEPVVCVGQIVSHERLPDGKYNLLLQGQGRARVVREISTENPYRVAELLDLVEAADRRVLRLRYVEKCTGPALAAADIETCHIPHGKRPHHSEPRRDGVNLLRQRPVKQHLAGLEQADGGYPSRTGRHGQEVVALPGQGEGRSPAWSL